MASQSSELGRGEDICLMALRGRIPFVVMWLVYMADIEQSEAKLARFVLPSSFAWCLFRLGQGFGSSVLVLICLVAF
jgi:hypothetical protein